MTADDPEELLDPDEIERIDRNVNALGNRVSTLALKVDELNERIDQQQYVIDQLVTDLPTQTKSSREKKAAIISRAAKDASAGSVRGYITKPKAAGAADCTERHALNLLHEIGISWPWAEYDPDGDPHARLLLEFGDGGPAAFLERLADHFPEVADQ